MRPDINQYLLFLFFLVFISCQKDESNSPEEEKQHIGVAEFNIASYNILHDTEDIPDHYNWSARKELVFDLIEANDLDILCVQEDRPNQASDIQKATGMLIVGTAKRIFYNGKRFVLRTNGSFFLSETPDKDSMGWDAASKRSCTWALFNDRHTGRDFFVFNTHFDHIGVIAREKSALLMKSRIQSIAKNQPVILTGDLNTNPGTQPIVTLSTILKDSRAMSESNPVGPIGTFNGMDINRDLSNGRIDYVFTSANVKVKEYKVIADIINGIFPSDHFPVIIKANLQ